VIGCIVMHLRLIKSLFTLTSALIVCLGSSFTFEIARAQELYIEEVLVTALKREENLQAIPIAITALTSRDLENRQLFSLPEIHNYVPNLQIVPTPAASLGSASLTIRGIGQVDFITTTEPGVGLYLDGVYLARVTGSALDLVDIERVEVLRGPQGTLFGRNTVGGAVSVVSAKPRGEFGGKAEFLAGMYTDGAQGKFRGRLSLDFPISDNLAGKVSILGKTSSGYGVNTVFDFATLSLSGEGLGEDDDVAARLALLYDSNDDFQLYFTFDKSHRSGTVIPHGQIAGIMPIPKEDPRSVVLSAPTHDNLDVTGVSLQADWAIGNANFKSITAYREQKGNSGQDFDGSILPFIDHVADFEQDQFSQEFQLFGNSLEDRLDWLVGAYYFTEDGDFRSDVVFFLEPRFVSTLNTTHSYAAFGQFTYRISDQFSITGGLRYSDETKKFDGEHPAFGIARTAVEEDFSATSPKIGIEYTASPDLMIYASYTEGFRSGGFNGRPFSQGDFIPFDKEINKSYEIGIKSTLADNTLRLNAAVFLSEYEDIQLSAISTDGMGGIVIATDNAGQASFPGAELESRWLISERLQLVGAFGFIDNDEIEPRVGFNLTTGNTLPQAPRFNSMLGFEYNFPISKFDGMFGLDWSHRDQYFQLINNSVNVQEDGYSLINARLIISKAEEDWNLSVYGKNLGNAVYRVAGEEVSLVPYSTVFFGPTREIGMALSYTF